MSKLYVMTNVRNVVLWDFGAPYHSCGVSMGWCDCPVQQTVVVVDTNMVPWTTTSWTVFGSDDLGRVFQQDLDGWNLAEGFSLED